MCDEVNCVDSSKEESEDGKVGEHSVEEEAQEMRMIMCANTIQRPGTMMVHFQYTSSTDTAMMCPRPTINSPQSKKRTV